MEGILGFIVDDWKKIPQNYRYLILGGGFFLFNAWLLDHWGINSPYRFFFFDLRFASYNFGLILIVLAFALLISKQFYAFGKLVWYRKRYPINKLDIDFYLVWFNGKLILFDIKSKPKKYYHVYPWETAQNLLFVGRGIQSTTNFNPNAIEEFLVNYERKRLKLKQFKNGGSICTEI